MRILGVDPGLTRCGVGIIDTHLDRSLGLVDVVVIQTAPTLPLPERLLLLKTEFVLLFETHKPDRIAIERVFAQQNLSSVMGVAQASAIAMVEAATRGIPVDLHTPSEVKASITGSGRANKAQVAAMVRRLIPLGTDTFLPDATDALALAICNAWRGRADAVTAVTSAGGVQTSLTPAQQRWREAESRARHSRRTN
ncbi:crossover junction endodeoxyribonuclease RuvC [Alpinimonas psychrophila]|uniref:Crossover junction endodeoxyribonuclease RuvC n=1 Tax=Alpinimonas psychrophila TaxID=748908 RepID=A0A7W3PN62_9MICO|nr:crossover junction endodeoxyribonuclease RuvC [Alpinimonas psychrophila]MBA8828544.1 crossover junction endodeoxyribonuclease RuvC [Alpinimonas psychrophila]